MDEASQILGVAPDASRDEVERAYGKLVRRYPPELHPRRFARIHEAYMQLSSLEHWMLLVHRQPEAALAQLIPRPPLRLRPAAAPPPLLEPSEADLAPLWDPLRRTLLCELLQRELGRGERSAEPAL